MTCMLSSLQWVTECSNFSTDAWKSLTKASVHGICAIVNNKSYTVQLIEATALNKDGPAQCEQFAAMIDEVQDKYKCLIIFFTTDCDGSAKKGRDLLAKLRPYLLILACWAHQVQFFVSFILCK